MAYHLCVFCQTLLLHVYLCFGYGFGELLHIVGSLLLQVGGIFIIALPQLVCRAALLLFHLLLQLLAHLEVVAHLLILILYFLQLLLQLVVLLI